MNFNGHDRLIAQGFEPWESKELKGYYRRITFKKSALVGPVAEYCADDYVIVSHNGEQSVQRLLREVQGISDVVTQRFLLIDYPNESIQNKSFLMGFKGWLKLRGATAQSDRNCKAFTDLLYATFGKE